MLSDSLHIGEQDRAELVELLEDNNPFIQIKLELLSDPLSPDDLSLDPDQEDVPGRCEICQELFSHLLMIFLNMIRRMCQVDVRSVKSLSLIFG